MSANTGTAGAIHRVGFFAGEPAPTGITPPLKLMYLWEQVYPRTAQR